MDLCALVLSTHSLQTTYANSRHPVTRTTELTRADKSNFCCSCYEKKLVTSRD